MAVGDQLGSGVGTTQPATGSGYSNYYNPYQYNWNQPGRAEDNQIIGGPNGYLENEPRAIYERHRSNQGITNTGAADYSTNYDQWSQGEFSAVYDAYQSAYADDPFLEFQDFMKGVDLQAMFNGLSQQERGINDANAAQRVAWIPR